jgi:hypothetical protein
MKRNALRFAASFVVGLITFFALAALLNATGGYMFVERYHSLWGLSHFIAMRIDPPGPGDGEFFGSFGSVVDFFLGIVFWVLFFGFAYYYFLFRRRQSI